MLIYKKGDFFMLEWINRYVFGATLPIMLMAVGVFFGFYLKWFYIRHPVKTVKAAVEGGGRSAFSSLCLALAGTLGVGNLVGVASAIALGGSGAVFWIWVSALLAMILKYAETVLALKHRRAEGGSAMSYIEDGFAQRGSPLLGKIIAPIFALLLLLNAFSMGSGLQTEAVASALSAAVGLPKLALSVALAIVTFIIICRGKSRIMSLTEKMVPLMTVGFALVSLLAIIKEIDRLPIALAEIIKNAFKPNAAAGGVLGFLTSRALRFGTVRGLISNEAGCGTSPMAHSEAEKSSPVGQGVWGIFEVLVDTVVLCTATALVIILSGVPTSGKDFMSITSGAYAALLGEGAGMFIAVSVAFFGFATVICWSHYGMVATAYLSNKSLAKKLFVLAYVLSVALGGIVAPEALWQWADLSIGALTLINLFALLLCRKEIKSESGKLM